MDFTHCGELGVTVGVEPFDHLLFQFILSHSGWRYAQVCFGETFSALVSGLQGALWELGAVPEVVKTDNLSAALACYCPALASHKLLPHHYYLSIRDQSPHLLRGR